MQVQFVCLDWRQQAYFAGFFHLVGAHLETVLLLWKQARQEHIWNHLTNNTKQRQKKSIYVKHLSSHSFSINVKQSSVLYLALVGPCGLKTYRHVELQFTAVFTVVHVLSIRQVVRQQSDGRRADDQTHQVEQQSCFYLQGIGSRPFSTAI